MKELNKLFELWGQYKKDEKVLYNKNPPMGIVYSFEGFWQWLLDKSNP